MKTWLWQSIVIALLLQLFGAVGDVVNMRGALPLGIAGSAIYAPPPYQPQIASALYRMERCSPQVYKVISRVVSEIEYDERLNGGLALPWKPSTIILGTSLLVRVRPNEETELSLIHLMAHEAQHLRQYRNLAWWLDLRFGVDEWRSRKEYDANLFAYSVLRDCAR